ncbi:HNH/ENDO VII family nuclease [Methylomusa anaerophila]|uniref:HNH/ENDO VII family nuclease n=1 Tax=Methylomusa anaerophila TaxID=1930071 RepID=UPI000F84B64D|nr:HNH/ENDO VII family nuclease [Methylomusa anaerophila]
MGKNTDLKGAVIASDATPDKNILSTDTLTYSDIQNHAEYDSSSVGVNVNTNPSAERNEQGVTPNIGVTAKGDADSTTKSAISPGTIEIRSNPDQDLSTLSRDTNNSLNTLGKIFDKKTVQEQQELAKVFGEEVFKAVGDLKLKEGSSEKAAIDFFVGGLMAKLGGGDFLSGAASGGITQLVMKELADIKDPALLQWASAIVGAASAKVIGGNAQTGASVAASETKNNFLYHEQYQKMLEELEAVDKSDKSPEEKEKAKADIKAEYEKIDKEQNEKWQKEHQVTLGDINENPGTISLEKVGVNLDGTDAYLIPGAVIIDKSPSVIETFIYDPNATATENAHKLLSIGGFTPLAPISEGVNAIIYLAEGDNEAAVMSAFAAIPGMEIVKVANGVIKLVPKAEEAIKFVQAYTKEVKAGENVVTHVGEDAVKVVKGSDSVSVVGEARKYWTQATEYNGVKVYQRNDLINPNLVDDYGRTNLQRMQQGIAPIGPDGKSINLHHMTQTNDSAIAEITQSFHQENTKVIHINPNTIPSGIDRSAFDTWKKTYWKNRANDFK